MRKTVREPISIVSVLTDSFSAIRTSTKAETPRIPQKWDQQQRILILHEIAGKLRRDALPHQSIFNSSSNSNGPLKKTKIQYVSKDELLVPPVTDRVEQHVYTTSIPISVSGRRVRRVLKLEPIIVKHWRNEYCGDQDQVLVCRLRHKVDPEVQTDRVLRYLS